MKTASLTEQSLYLMAGRLCSYLLELANPIIFVRVLQQYDYGVYRQLMLLASTLFPIGQMGVTQGLFYFLRREPEKRDALVFQTFLFVFSTGLVVLIALVLFSGSIADLFNSVEMSALMPLIAVHCFFMISSSFLQSVIIAEGRAELAAAITVLFQVIYSLFAIAGIIWTRDIVGLLYALVIYSAIRFVFQVMYLRRRYHFTLASLDLPFLRRQLGYSLPMGVANISWLLQQKLHSYFVAFMFTPAIYAVYSIGSYNLPFITMLNAAVANTMAPALSVMQKDGQMEKLLRTWNSAMRKSNLLLCPAFVFLFLMADQFIIALFSDAYSGAVPVFRISLLLVLVSSVRPEMLLQATAKTTYIMRLTVFRVPVAIGILYVFAHRWGVLGAISANVVIETAFRFGFLRRASRVLGIPALALIQWGPNLRILAVALLAGLPICAIRMVPFSHPLLSLAIGAVAYAAAYPGLSFLFRTVQPEEWRAAIDFGTRLFRRASSKIPSFQRMSKTLPEAER
ncbi:MAG: oligosaccharide flippase family protein [bacterium]